MLEKRQSAVGMSPYGVGIWWLTIDYMAAKVTDVIERETGRKIFSPVISLDFLLQYLVFGPRRESVELGNIRIFSDVLWEVVPTNLVAIAQDIRRNNAELPERVIRRKIRDELDRQRTQLGPVHLGGLEKLDETLASMQ